MSIPKPDRHEMYGGHSDAYIGFPGATLAAMLHAGNPGVGLFIPTRLAMYLSSWDAAAVYAFIAQASMAGTPLGGVDENEPPGDEVILTHVEIGLGTGLTEYAVSKAIKEIAERGLLTVTKRKSEAHEWAPVNHYRCNFDVEARILDEWVGSLR